MASYTVLTSKNTPGYDFEKGYTALQRKSFATEKFVPKADVGYSVVVPKKVVRSGVSSTFKIDGNCTSLGCGLINGVKCYLAGFSDAGLYKSEDCVKWELIEGTESYSPVSICYGIRGGSEVFLISTFDDGLFIYDGTNLLSISDQILGKNPLREMYYNGSWKAAGYSGIYSSLNGVVWTKDSIVLPSGETEDPSFYNIKFADDIWFAASDDGIWRYNENSSNWIRENIELDNEDVSDISFVALEYIPVDNLSNNSSSFWLAYCEEFTYSGLWKYDGTSWSKLDIDYPGITRIIYSNGVIYLTGNSGSYHSIDFGSTFIPYINEAYNPETYEIPNDAIELTNGGTLTGTKKYKITSNLYSNIVIDNNADVTLYIGTDVELRGSGSHTIYIKLGGKLTIYSNGLISNQNISSDGHAIIMNNGICLLYGGRYKQYNKKTSGSYWYHVVNHGELMELTNVKIDIDEIDRITTSSTIVNGYPEFTGTTDEGKIYVPGVNNISPEMIIHSGYYKTPISTHLIKCDHRSRTTIENGIFINTYDSTSDRASSVLFAGNELNILGGSFIGYMPTTKCLNIRLDSTNPDICGGVFNIYGGRFIPHDEGYLIHITSGTEQPIGNIYGGVFYKYFSGVSEYIKDPSSTVVQSGDNYVVNSNKSTLYREDEIEEVDSNYSINVLFGDCGDLLIGTNRGICIDYLSYNSYYDHSYSLEYHPIKSQLDDWKLLTSYTDSSFRIRDWEFYLDNNKLKARKVEEN